MTGVAAAQAPPVSLPPFRRRRALAVSWAALVVCVAVLLVVGAHPAHPAGSPASRAAHIASLVRCPSCSDLSVADSNAPAARTVRDDIAARIRAGQSDAQILAYIESRYGPSILLSPPHRGIDWLVWTVPVVVTAAAGVVLVAALWTRRSRPFVPTRVASSSVPAEGKRNGPAPVARGG